MPKGGVEANINTAHCKGRNEWSAKTVMSDKQEIKSKFPAFFTFRSGMMMKNMKFSWQTTGDVEREISHLIGKFNWKIPLNSSVAGNKVEV